MSQRTLELDIARGKEMKKTKVHNEVYECLKCEWFYFYIQSALLDKFYNLLSLISRKIYADISSGESSTITGT